MGKRKSARVKPSKYKGKKITVGGIRLYDLSWGFLTGKKKK
jgi:hypothetical protein